jgi:hypothetical protein
MPRPYKTVGKIPLNLTLDFASGQAFCQRGKLKNPLSFVLSPSAADSSQWTGKTGKNGWNLSVVVAGKIKVGE